MLARSGGAVNKVRPEDALVLMGFELLKKKKKEKKNLYKYTPGGHSPSPFLSAHTDIFMHSYRMNSF